MHLSSLFASYSVSLLTLATFVSSASLPESPHLVERSCDPLNPDTVTAPITAPIAVADAANKLIGYLDNGQSGGTGTEFDLTSDLSNAGNFTFATCNGAVYVATCIVRSSQL